jgi:hypothetical protein
MEPGRGCGGEGGHMCKSLHEAWYTVVHALWMG